MNVRSFSNTSLSSAKVAVLGAAGGIGQPLSMLLKLSDEVTELACYDIVGTPGVAADLSHVSWKIENTILKSDLIITYYINFCGIVFF